MPSVVRQVIGGSVPAPGATRQITLYEETAPLRFVLLMASQLDATHDKLALSAHAGIQRMLAAQQVQSGETELVLFSDVCHTVAREQLPCALLVTSIAIYCLDASKFTLVKHRIPIVELQSISTCIDGSSNADPSRRDHHHVLHVQDGQSICLRTSDAQCFRAFGYCCAAQYRILRRMDNQTLEDQQLRGQVIEPDQLQTIVFKGVEQVEVNMYDIEPSSHDTSSQHAETASHSGEGTCAPDPHQRHRGRSICNYIQGSLGGMAGYRVPLVYGTHEHNTTSSDEHGIPKCAQTTEVQQWVADVLQRDESKCVHCSYEWHLHVMLVVPLQAVCCSHANALCAHVHSNRQRHSAEWKPQPADLGLDTVFHVSNGLTMCPKCICYFAEWGHCIVSPVDAKTVDLICTRKVTNHPLKNAVLRMPSREATSLAAPRLIWPSRVMLEAAKRYYTQQFKPPSDHWC